MKSISSILVFNLLAGYSFGGVINSQSVNSQKKSKSAEPALGLMDVDSKKLIASEVKTSDGKFTTLDKFLKNGPPNPPGILSYESSEDFPNEDNGETLGNLNPNNIWLSDGHLLVLKGDDNEEDQRDKFKPIDNYVRDESKPPLRILLNSTNPPPFPVFLHQSGPPVFLKEPPPFFGPFPLPYPTENETLDPMKFPFYPGPGMIPNETQNEAFPGFFGPPPPGQGEFNQTIYPPHMQPFPFPFDDPQIQMNQNKSVRPNSPNDAKFRFPFGPFPHPPTGSEPILLQIPLNPKDNITDDPNFLLPPPYDFQYAEPNPDIVPPGPMIPGIAIPPPKEFYTVSLTNKTNQRE